MAASPPYKIYHGGTYEGCCKDPVAAAVLSEWYGNEAEVRYGHRRTVWTESADRARGLSHDDIGSLIRERS